MINLKNTTTLSITLLTLLSFSSSHCMLKRFKATISEIAAKTIDFVTPASKSTPGRSQESIEDQINIPNHPEENINLNELVERVANRREKRCNGEEE